MAETASQSVFWSAVNRFSTQAIQFVVSLVIARLVAPSEFGLIAMLSIFIGISQVFVDGGFNNALIQKQGRTNIDYSTIFYFNIAIALLLYVILFFGASLIAIFYEQPILVPLTRWVALSIIINSLTMIQRTIMSIEHDFKTQAIIAIAAVIVSGTIGILCALKGLGVWALVAQTLSSSGVFLLLFWLMSKWRPLFVFSIESFKSLFSFGSKVLASGILNTIYINLYNLVIGKVYKPEELGYYTKANSITQLPTTSIALTLQGAVYPFLCEAQNDDERLKSIFLVYTRMICFVVFPIVACMVVLAEPFVVTILTEKWLPAVPLMQILILAYSLYPLCYINCQTLNVKGRSDLFLKTDLLVKGISVVVLAASVPFGIKVMCWSLVIFYIINYIIVSYNVKKVVKITLVEQIKSIIPTVSITIISGGISYLFTLLISNMWVKLIAGGIVLLVLFLLLAKVFKMREITLMFKYARQIIKK